MIRATLLQVTGQPQRHLRQGRRALRAGPHRACASQPPPRRRESREGNPSFNLVKNMLYFLEMLDQLS